MATTTKNRDERAQGREERRRAAEERAKTRPPKPQAEEAQDEQGGDAGESKGGVPTAALVLGGAAVGAIVGTARSLRKRKHDEDEGADEPADREPSSAGESYEDDEGYDDEPQASGDENGGGGESGGAGAPSGTLRGIVVSALESALEGL